MSAVREAVLRTLCFHAAWDHAPTLPELVSGLDIGNSFDAISREDVVETVQTLVDEELIASRDGRYGLTARLGPVLDTMRERDILQPRKRRAAVRAAHLLARMGARFVALANTTALGNARDGGDLDLFVVTRHGRIWTTRLLTAGPLRLLGKLPTAEEVPDAVCLSYFISDRGLDLSSHMLLGDDPYFRHWFLSLLPLHDDGIGDRLWDANQRLLRRHPFARPWVVPPDLRVATPRLRFGLGGIGEGLAERFQRRWFPAAIRERQNKGSEVIVQPHALKFHVDDRRADFKKTYETSCESLGLRP